MSFVPRPFKYLSSSQVSNWRSCQRLWFYNSILGIKSPQTPQMELGTALHKMNENALLSGTMPAKTGLSDVERQARDLFYAGKHMIEPLIGKVRPEMNLETEIPPGFTLDGLYIKGSIDAADLRTLPPHIIDFKTSSSLKYAKSEEDLLNDPQIIFYSHFIRLYIRHIMGLPEPRTVKASHFVYITKGKNITKQTEVLLSANHIDEKWEWLNGIARKMRETALIPTVDQVPATLSNCSKYGGKLCHYAQYCSAFTAVSKRSPFAGIESAENDEVPSFNIFANIENVSTDSASMPSIDYSANSESVPVDTFGPIRYGDNKTSDSEPPAFVDALAALKSLRNSLDSASASASILKTTNLTQDKNVASPMEVLAAMKAKNLALVAAAQATSATAATAATPTPTPAPAPVVQAAAPKPAPAPTPAPAAAPAPVVIPAGQATPGPVAMTALQILAAKALAASRPAAATGILSPDAPAPATVQASVVQAAPAPIQAPAVEIAPAPAVVIPATPTPVPAPVATVAAVTPPIAVQAPVAAPTPTPIPAAAPAVVPVPVVAAGAVAQLHQRKPKGYMTKLTGLGYTDAQIELLGVDQMHDIVDGGIRAGAHVPVTEPAAAPIAPAVEAVTETVSTPAALDVDTSTSASFESEPESVSPPVVDSNFVPTRAYAYHMALPRPEIGIVDIAQSEDGSLTSSIPNLITNYYRSMPKVGDGTFTFTFKPLDANNGFLPGRAFNLPVSESNPDLVAMRSKMETATAPQSVVTPVLQAVQPTYVAPSTPVAPVAVPKLEDRAESSGISLYINCVPVKGTNGTPIVRLEEYLRPLMAQVAAGGESGKGPALGHYSMIDYGKGPSRVVALLLKNPPTGIVVADRSLPCTDACLEVLIPMSTSVIQGIR